MNAHVQVIEGRNEDAEHIGIRTVRLGAIFGATSGRAISCRASIRAARTLCNRIEQVRKLTMVLA